MSLIDYFAVHIVPRMYRGKGALHPAETGRLTDQVSCVREYDVDIFFIQKGDVRVQALLVPGHTLGHLCYLIDDTLLFTGDSIALNKEGGWCFNYDSKLNQESLAALKNRVDLSVIQYVFTSHNGFTDNAQSAFRHIEVIPDLNAKGVLFDETAPYDCFDMKG